MKLYGTYNCRICPAAVYWIHSPVPYFSYTDYRNKFGEITEGLSNKSGAPKDVPGPGGNLEAPNNVADQS